MFVENIPICTSNSFNPVNQHSILGPPYTRSSASGIEHMCRARQCLQLAFANQTLRRLRQRQSDDEKIEATKELQLLTGAKNPVRQHAFRIAGARNNIGVCARSYPVARLHVHTQPHLLREPRGLPTDAARAPQSYREAADLALEKRASVPNASILIANHLSRVPGEVDHHRHIPLGDGYIKAPATVRGAGTASGQK